MVVVIIGSIAVTYLQNFVIAHHSIAPCRFAANVRYSPSRQKIIFSHIETAMQGMALRATSQCLETFLHPFWPCGLLRIRPGKPVALRADRLDSDDQATHFEQILRQPFDLWNDLGRHFTRRVSNGAAPEGILHFDNKQGGSAGREIVMDMRFSTTF